MREGRSIPEPAPFGIRIADDGPASPVRLLYVPAPDKAAKLGRAERMALAYMATQTLPVKTGDVIRHLHAGGVAVRTAERALPRLKALDCVRSPERGIWELVEVGNALVYTPRAEPLPPTRHYKKSGGGGGNAARAPSRPWFSSQPR